MSKRDNACVVHRKCSINGGSFIFLRSMVKRRVAGVRKSMKFPSGDTRGMYFLSINSQILRLPLSELNHCVHYVFHYIMFNTVRSIKSYIE